MQRYVGVAKQLYEAMCSDAYWMLVEPSLWSLMNTSIWLWLCMVLKQAAGVSFYRGIYGTPL